MSFGPISDVPPHGRSVQEQRERWERKRTRICQDLLQTERKYCQELQLVTTYFVEILSAKGTLKPDVREKIFSSIKHIHNLNQALLVHLENGYLVRGLDQFCPELHHYRVYADNFYSARRVLQMQLKKSKAFRRFKKLQESRPEFRGQRLEELLELPLTRLQQYKKFVEDLMSNTKPQDEDFQQLKRAVGALSELSHHVQENARHHDNQLQLQRVQRLLTGNTRIHKPGRWYIREGWLQVVPPRGSEAKPRMFFLFSDVLLETRPSSALALSPRQRFHLLRALPLSRCAVDKVFGHTRSQGGLLSLSFPEVKLLLMSSDQDDFNDWNTCLTSAVRKFQSQPTVLHDRVVPQSSGALHRKRPALSEQEPVPVSAPEAESSAPKRRRQEPAAQSDSSSCAIL